MMLRDIPEDNAGLPNLPEDVRNKMGYKRKGGKVKKMAAGGSASKRADGCAVKGKTRGKMI